MIANLKIAPEIIDKSNEPTLVAMLKRDNSFNNDDDSRNPLVVSTTKLSEPMLRNLMGAAEELGSHRLKNSIAAILDSREGKTNVSKFSLREMPELVKRHFDAVADQDIAFISVSRNGEGRALPYLFNSATFTERTSRDDMETVILTFVAAKMGESRNDPYPSNIAKVTRSITFLHEDLKGGRSLSQVLEDHGITLATPEMNQEYEKRTKRFISILTKGFSEQYVLNGSYMRGYSTHQANGERVVHATPRSSYRLRPLYIDTPNSKSHGELDGYRAPFHHDLLVFNLKQNIYHMVSADDLTEYVYDREMVNKIVLPEDQRELLEILTSDTDVLTSDIVDGKSAGNLILAKGKPGLGKTLTAEVFSEYIERPLYSLHSGVLGITATEVRDKLGKALKTAKDLNLVILIDEADVFIKARGDDIAQNAIVAEFLQVLEYFDGIIFMTTNRGDSVDDAIESRTAALIDYRAPGVKQLPAVWRIMSDIQKADLSDELIADLVSGFPDASPRDVKNLLRLTLRSARSKGEELSLFRFVKCSMFKGLHFEGDVDALEPPKADKAKVKKKRVRETGVKGEKRLTPFHEFLRDFVSVEGVHQESDVEVTINQGEKFYDDLFPDSDDTVNMVNAEDEGFIKIHRAESWERLCPKGDEHKGKPSRVFREGISWEFYKADADETEFYAYRMRCAHCGETWYIAEVGGAA